MTTKPKRDHAEGATASADYYKSAPSKLKVTSFTSSKRQARINIPKSETRKVRESHIQTEITRYLRSRGAWVHKAKAVNLVGDGILASTQVGVPDLLVCYDGHFVALEIKAATNKAKVSGDQLAQIDLIIVSGGVAAVVWSVDQVEALLDALDEGHDLQEIHALARGFLKYPL